MGEGKAKLHGVRVAASAGLHRAIETASARMTAGYALGCGHISANPKTIFLLLSRSVGG